jgi:hypothetical protein
MTVIGLLGHTWHMHDAGIMHDGMCWQGADSRDAVSMSSMAAAAAPKHKHMGHLTRLINRHSVVEGLKAHVATQAYQHQDANRWPTPGGPDHNCTDWGTLLTMHSYLHSYPHPHPYPPI